MKKLYLFLSFLIISGITLGQDLVITGIIDGPLPGGLPKALELYVVNNIPDMSIYGLESTTNGADAVGQEFTFPSEARTAGEYIYVGTEQPYFNQYLGFDPTYIDAVINVNGDDTIILYLNSVVNDLLGEIGVDGSGTAWDTLDGWAYRVDGFGPNDTFTASEWTFSGINATDGCDLVDDTGTNAGCASVFPVMTYSPTPSSDPTLFITSPTEGQEFPAGTTEVTISISVQNFDVASSGGDGHIHYYVNGAGPNLRFDTSDFSVSPVTDGGSYTVYMELVDDGHTPISPAVNATVNFTVANPLPSLPLYDNFDYPDGSLVPNGGWANHSGTIGDLLVTSGQVLVQHGTPDEDANLAFTPVAGNIYFGIDFTVVDPGGPIPGPDNEYFVHFKDAGFGYAARLDIVPPSGVGDFSVGIASINSTADNVWGADLNYGVTYRAIVRYDQDENIAELWINAATESDTSILGADETNPGLSIESFAFRQSDSDLNEGILVDNLIVSGSFAASLSTKDNHIDGFSFSPNPTSIGYINITSKNQTAMKVGVYDILGKQVINETVSNNRLDVSNLTTGIYIMKISQDNATTSKKLIIK